MNIEPLKSILDISSDKKDTLLYFLPLNIKERVIECDLEDKGLIVHLIGGAEMARELDAKQAIDQGTRLACLM